jgi:hypothetical protein
VNDEASKARLYFMYNPESIVRQYESYLDQSALDPFNTIYQSGNLVAPPSYMSFSFSLMFDRQQEATDPGHPGVFVDYQFFDLVVRNVIPSATPGNGALPDNGVMMINPRDITVVFSPQMTVQGRPLNAQVSFDKFSHRMTPTRMTVQLEMLVVYFGPLQPVGQSFQLLDIQTTAQIASTDPAPIDITFTNVVYNILASSEPGVPNVSSTGTPVASSQVATAALQWAQSNDCSANPALTYDGSARLNWPSSVDCSGWVGTSYEKVGGLAAMGWYHGIDSFAMYQTGVNKGTLNRLVEGTGPIQAALADPILRQNYFQFGNIGFRHMSADVRGGHVAFIVGASDSTVTVNEASSPTSKPPVGTHVMSHKSFYDFFNSVCQPTPFGSQSVSGGSAQASSTSGQVIVT